MRHWFTSLVFAGIAATAAVADDHPVVVELFTSQGCSSCPPADALLHDLAKDPDVVALALHVDYWDYIGWKDSFASPAFTQRQRNYARAQSETMVYTPQMMINGVEHVVGNRTVDVLRTIDRHKARTQTVTMDASLNGSEVIVSLADATDAGPYIVHLVSYRPESEVSIRRGENAGRTIAYTNVVTNWRSIAEWSGTTPRSYRANAPDLPAIAIVQRKGYGEILGAVRLTGN